MGSSAKNPVYYLISNNWSRGRPDREVFCRLSTSEGHRQNIRWGFITVLNIDLKLGPFMDQGSLYHDDVVGWRWLIPNIRIVPTLST
jgi:hypothetical protein